MVQPTPERLAFALVCAVFAGRLVLADDTTKISAEEARKLKNPIAYSRKSIADGRAIFVRNCASCHGSDGKAQVDVVADATDLTSPKLWKSGTSDGEIYRSIHDGAGETMPPFKAQLGSHELWNLVNFIRSLWPESTRPPLAKEGN